MIGVGCGSPRGGGSGGSSLAVTVSNSTPNVGDTITITATPTGITPTNYLFFAYDEPTDTISFIAEQSSNVFNWAINLVGVKLVYVVANDATPDHAAESVEITISSLSITNSTKFNGTDEYVYVPYNASLEFGTSARSYSIWFKVDVLSGLRSIFSNNGSSSTMVSALMDGSNLRLFLNTFSATIDFAVSVNTWSLLTITKDGSGNWNVYLNGVLKGSRTSTNSTDTGGQIYFGTQDGSQRFHDGNIVLPIFYDKELSLAEVVELYNGGVAIDPRSFTTSANLVEFWGFGNGTDNSPTIVGLKGVQDATMVNMDNSNFIADVPT